MNEIKKIHLGRQPFTISVDAHKLLRTYLEAIEHQVGAKSEVLKEVESRMAELLIERGVKGEKVILEDDVEFLKEQLGDPGDFKDDEHQAAEGEETQDGQKRLFRDTQNGMIAGVASGLAAYFNVDVTIVRLIFVVALFFGGAAIPVYLVLWLVMPEAKTPSERLQMQGKAVTVDTLKELVDRADVKGAADRASKMAGPIFERLMRVILAIIGATFVTIAVAMFVALTMALAYLFFHKGGVIANAIPFPVGNAEITFTAMSAAVVAIFSFLLLFAGMSMVNRRWSIPGWVTAALIFLMLTAGAIGTAVGADTVKGVHDRYKAAQVVDIKKQDTFTSVVIKGNNIDAVYEQSDKYEAGVRYIGHDNAPKGIKYTVKDGVLTVDATKVDDRGCAGICIAPNGFDEIVIRAPKLDKITSDSNGSTMYRIYDGERIDTGDWGYENDY